MAECSRNLVVELAAGLPGLGCTVAVDSTDLNAHSNGSKRRKSDPDAAWSAKKGPNGKTMFWFGYKEHLICDAETNLACDLGKSSLTRRMDIDTSQIRCAYPSECPALIVVQVDSKVHTPAAPAPPIR